MYFRLCFKNKCLIVLTFLIVIYNEFLIFKIYSLSWITLKLSQGNENVESVKILLVADPQIVGLQDEDIWWGSITRMDCDNYLQRGFKEALSHVEPDLILFLGDLMDEGSKANENEYQTYLKRFKTIFSTAPKDIQAVYIPGDNDIGGDGKDKVETWKTERFNKAFNLNYSQIHMQSFKFLDIIKAKFIRDQASSLEEIFSVIKLLRLQSIKILLNHIGVMKIFPPSVLQNISHSMDFNLILSGHEHESGIISCSNCFLEKQRKFLFNFPTFYKQNYFTVDIKLSTKMGDLYEIMLPTCSYRMGKKKMGYGAMLIDSNGKMQHTVLRLPPRVSLLWFYLYYFSVLAFYIILNIIFRLLKRKSE